MNALAPFVKREALDQARADAVDAEKAYSARMADIIRQAPASKQFALYLAHGTRLTEEDLQAVTLEIQLKSVTPPPLNIGREIEPYLPMVHVAALSVVLGAIGLPALWLAPAIVWLVYAVGFGVFNLSVVSELRLLFALQVALLFQRGIPELATGANEILRGSVTPSGAGLIATALVLGLTVSFTFGESRR